MTSVNKRRSESSARSSHDIPLGNGWQRWKLCLGSLWRTMSLPGELRLALGSVLLSRQASQRHGNALLLLWPQSLMLILPLFGLVLFDIVLLCNPGWAKAHCAAQASLTCVHPPASALLLLGFQVCLMIVIFFGVGI